MRRCEGIYRPWNWSYFIIDVWFRVAVGPFVSGGEVPLEIRVSNFFVENREHQVASCRYPGPAKQAQGPLLGKGGGV